jgi:hypothetical protein
MDGRHTLRRARGSALAGHDDWGKKSTSHQAKLAA